MTYLDPVSRAVEKANAANTVEDGVAAVLQHVVSADRRLALSLSGKDGALHDSEILFVQHLRHIWQLPTEEKARVNVKTKLTAQKKQKIKKLVGLNLIKPIRFQRFYKFRYIQV